MYLILILILLERKREFLQILAKETINFGKKYIYNFFLKKFTILRVFPPEMQKMQNPFPTWYLVQIDGGIGFRSAAGWVLALCHGGSWCTMVVAVVSLVVSCC